MERMKAQLCRPPARSRRRLPPARSAKPTFDFYFGSRQHSTWEGVEKPHSSSPATSGAGALRRRGGSRDPEEEPRGPTPGPHPAFLRDGAPRKGGMWGQEWDWGAKDGDPKRMKVIPSCPISLCPFAPLFWR